MSSGCRTALVFAFAALLGPTTCAAAADRTGPAEIIDGDTIRVGGDTVRLEGIDAPENRQECEDAAGRAYPCGASATR